MKVIMKILPILIVFTIIGTSCKKDCNQNENEIKLAEYEVPFHLEFDQNISGIATIRSKVYTNKQYITYQFNPTTNLIPEDSFRILLNVFSDNTKSYKSEVIHKYLMINVANEHIVDSTQRLSITSLNTELLVFNNSLNSPYDAWYTGTAQFSKPYVDTNNIIYDSIQIISEVCPISGYIDNSNHFRFVTPNSCTHVKEMSGILIDSFASNGVVKYQEVSKPIISAAISTQGSKVQLKFKTTEVEEVSQIKLLLTPEIILP